MASSREKTISSVGGEGRGGEERGKGGRGEGEQPLPGEPYLIFSPYHFSGTVELLNINSKNPHP